MKKEALSTMRARAPSALRDLFFREDLYRRADISSLFTDCRCQNDGNCIARVLLCPVKKFGGYWISDDDSSV